MRGKTVVARRGDCRDTFMQVVSKSRSKEPQERNEWDGQNKKK